MRYYEIEIQNADGSVYNNLKWSSLKADGSVDPGALRVILDVPLINFAANTEEMGHITIMGIDLRAISQSTQINQKFIKFNVGMSKGLPLANPNNNGPPLYGTIYQAYGNWIGNNMSLDIFFYKYTGSVSQPANFALNWEAGKPLGPALQTCLQAVFPNVKVNISSNIVPTSDQQHYVGTLNQLAAFVNQASRNIIDPNGTMNYQGVGISVDKNGVVNAFDPQISSSSSIGKQIAYTDIIGQPVWTGPLTIQLSVVMRADLDINDIIKLPTVNSVLTPQAKSGFRNTLTFSGNYHIGRIRLLGDSRQPNALSWITVIDAYDPGLDTQSNSTTTPTSTNGNYSETGNSNNVAYG